MILLWQAQKSEVFMLKNTDKYGDNVQFRPQEYRRKSAKEGNKDLTIFISVFIIGVLIILGFAKILSPNVDVTISNENEAAAEYDEQSTVSSIDDRLRNLQMEDNGMQEGDEEMFSPELDERVVLPQKKAKSPAESEDELKNNEAQAEKTDSKANSVQNKDEQVQKTETVTKPQFEQSSPERSVNAKVVVGYYATEKQAEVAKSIINDAGLSVIPVVKNLGGYYTLQVGSYSSREKAQQVANSLLKSNFPARVIVE